MAWPLSQDYNEAIQSPESAFNDPELRKGEVATNAIGLPMPRSGNFADVYEFKSSSRKWAIKCFTREVPGLRDRYAAISAYLKQAKLPFMVDFEYLDPGIKVRGLWYPVLKMHWVEGLTLNEFVNKNADQPATLELLSQLWVRLARKLREANVAHCDLQHGNVLLVPGRTAGSLAVKLIDYDGMWVPALAQKRSGELGHPNYQHPQRLREGTYNIEVDRFPHLVIYTALRSLMVGSRYLWNKFDNGDNLLFRQQDLNDPDKSALFRKLGEMQDVQTLVGALTTAIKTQLVQTPLLDEVVKRNYNDLPVQEEEDRQKLITSVFRTEPKTHYVRSFLVAVSLMFVLLAAVVGGFLFLNKNKQDKSVAVIAHASTKAEKVPETKVRPPETTNNSPETKRVEPPVVVKPPEPKPVEPPVKSPEPKPVEPPVKSPEPKPVEPPVVVKPPEVVGPPKPPEFVGPPEPPAVKPPEVKSFVSLDLSKASTAISTISREGQAHEVLLFEKWGNIVFKRNDGKEVPFHVIDPQDGKVKNAVILQGPLGRNSKAFPTTVTIPCDLSVSAIHILGCVSGWGWPSNPKISHANSLTMTVRLHYADRSKEDHELLNGVHFCTFCDFGPTYSDVPGSQCAFKLIGQAKQQMRYIAIVPKRNAVIKTIELVKGTDITSPITMAITVEKVSQSSPEIKPVTPPPPDVKPPEVKSFVRLDLGAASTAVSTSPREGPPGRGPSHEILLFEKWGDLVFKRNDGKDIPFHVIDPKDGKVKNAVILQGPLGGNSKLFPTAVTIPCNASVSAVHILGCIAGWGRPMGFSPQRSLSMIVRLHYADGTQEDHELLNGVHICDLQGSYSRNYLDVPESQLAFKLVGQHKQQVRYMAIVPNKNTVITTIELVKGKDNTSPITMAITVEEDAKGKAEAKKKAEDEAKATAEEEKEAKEKAEEQAKRKAAEDAKKKIEQDEMTAAAKLKIARMYYVEGKRPIALDRLREIIKDYPQTKAAQQAEVWLKEW